MATTTVTPVDRDNKALNIARNRKLSTKLLPDGKWQVLNVKGETVVNGADDPATALELAEQSLVAAEVHTRQEMVYAIVEKIEQTGRYGFVAMTSSKGIEWQVMDAGISGSTISRVGDPFPSLMSALLEIESRIDNKKRVHLGEGL